MNNFYKNISMWLIIGLAMVLLFQMFNNPQQGQETLSYSDFLARVESGSISQVTVQGDEITGNTGGKNFKTISPITDLELWSILRKSGVEVSVKQVEKPPWYVTILANWFPMLLLIGVWIFFMRQMQMGGGKAMSFGKSRHRLQEGEDTHVTFKDVAGIEEAKEELAEIIDFLREPQKFTKLGARIPTGVLLAGPPGTGKTLLARAIAGEAQVPFFSISGSDFVEMFVGVGASRVRDLFNQGKKNAPCIIFIDEIDAVGRHRGAGLGGGHDEREQTLNQLLVEMDGFEENEGVIIVAATNRPDVLDPALLRPGRFDRQVMVPIPDVGGREMILKVHAKKLPLAADVDWKVIARGTPGFSGADLENLVNEAALLAARTNEKAVTMADMEEAKDKVMMGAERKSMIITVKEKEITAYHEAGHALIARLLPGTDPVHKVTIIPRGRALGLTMQLPTEEKYSHSKSFLLNTICILLGGRVAEELIFEETTTGSGNDIERATALARKMVCEWGMSKEMGPLSFGKKEEQIFLGREISQHRDYSESTAIQIDTEVKNMILEANDKVFALLREHMSALKEMSELLLERETITSEDINVILEKHGIAFEKPAAAKDEPKVSPSPEVAASAPQNETESASAPAEEEVAEPPAQDNE
ncbi:MAG: ATP-dependent zinc metalloprotease FtsH [Thermodesulfobacteriota bacterium]